MIPKWAVIHLSGGLLGIMKSGAKTQLSTTMNLLETNTALFGVTLQVMYGGGHENLIVHNHEPPSKTLDTFG